MQEGKANLNYVPFHEVKAKCHDIGEEASHLAVFDDYPPRHARSTRVGPEWLKYKEWRKVIEMRARGKNILEIAAAVDKNASLLRVYVDTYLNTSTHDLPGPLPTYSASSTDSLSTADTSTGSDELFPLYDEVIVTVPGAPDPSFLSRGEQELVWKMFQRNETVRSMSEQLKKGRRKISQYINAYMRPRLLKLQEEEREAEYRLAGTSTHVTPLTNHSPRPRPTSTGRTATVTGNPPRLRREQSVRSIRETEFELVDPLVINTTLNVPNQSPEDSGGSAAVATPKSATASSLFGDSPVDGTEASPLTGIVSARQKEAVAQTTSNKRKLDDEEVPAEPQQAPKRLRHLSLP